MGSAPNTPSTACSIFSVTDSFQNTSLDTKLDQLDDLFSRIQAKHPKMSQGDMVSQLRRSIGKYAEGVWLEKTSLLHFG